LISRSHGAKDINENNGVQTFEGTEHYSSLVRLLSYFDFSATQCFKFLSSTFFEELYYLGTLPIRKLVPVGNSPIYISTHPPVLYPISSYLKNPAYRQIQQMLWLTNEKITTPTYCNCQFIFTIPVIRLKTFSDGTQEHL